MKARTLEELQERVRVRTLAGDREHHKAQLALYEQRIADMADVMAYHRENIERIDRALEQ